VLQFKGSISVFYREDFSARKENFRVISDDFVGTVGVGISIFELEMVVWWRRSPSLKCLNGLNYPG
jgi:hypothetical protein